MSNPQIADQQISANQIQNLKSAERIVGFFDMLGYPVDDRIEMTPEALNFSDDLSESVQRIEKISSVDEMLEVYLVEMISVTVARRKALTRSFRDFPMEFLFVLTDDYKRIDFMLLERKIPAYKDFGIGKRKALIHHHTFSVDRTNPDRIALRVLRRLSFTAFDQEGEHDPLGQYDKLKSAFTTARWSEPYFNNRALFSDYYLTERIPEHPSWEAEDRHQVFRAIRDVYANVGSLGGKDHQSLRRELIAPVMKELGFFVESLDSQEGPDLNLFAEAGARGEQLAFALCYPWNRYLDGRDAGGTDPQRGDENPGAVMVGLLEEGTASWGILTNGKIWRLYSAGAHSRATNYYEIDLEETLASLDPGKAFRYFYLFFRAEAFISQEQNLSGEIRELSFLDLVLEESDLYARQLGDRLKDTVFEEVFPYFAEGFIEGMGGAETLLELPEEEREEKLELVYRGTLTFLYRLLFLLYAESRDLLPVREVRGYYKNSLQRIKEDIAARAGDIEDLAPGNIREAFGKTEKDLYERFSKLCGIVDEGSPAKNVPVYNGGLFLTNPERARSQRDKEISRFLLDYPIPDQFFALGLDKMARDIESKKNSLGFIDYKSLGVRQLGSIYEGLLEFKVRVAAEEMAVVDGKKVEEIVPYKQAKQEGLDLLADGRGRKARERVLPRGEIYLVNDKRERKATGSYYTPDYIVKYIVEHAVGPVLDEKLEELKPRLQETEQKYRALLKRKREVEGVEPDPYRLLKVNFGEVILELFDIKVLDPAMGSGHFLVEAVDYITDRLVRFLDRYPFLSVFFEGMKETILNDLSDQGVAAEPELLTDVNLLKRHVLKRCIYGVDLNHMAVELAKVSLWLDCFTLGAPLSFLDHHLKCGNSLIGAMARELDEEDDQQMTFLTGPFAGLLRAAEIMRGVSLLTDVTLEQVQESRELFREYEEKAEPFKALLDIYVSKHFGVELAEEFLTVHDQDKVLNMIKGEADYPQVYKEVVNETQAINKKKRFFHWDLEFPEVFIDLENAIWKKDCGFDAVIGNPPWLMAGYYEDETMGYFKKEYFSATKKFDLYYLFLERSTGLISPEKYVGFILPNKFFHTEAAKNLRELLFANRLIRKVVDFKDQQLFDGATNYSCIVFLNNVDKEEFSYIESKKNLIRVKKFNLAFDEMSTDYLNFNSPILQKIFGKISRSNPKLVDLIEQFGSGVQSGADKVLVVGADTAQENKFENALLKPYLKGRNVNRYQVNSNPDMLIFPYKKVKGRFEIIEEDELEEKYSNIYSYLSKNKTTLSERKWFGKGPVQLEGKWYGMMYLDEAELFSKQHILTPSLSNRSSFAVGTGALFATGTAGVTSIILEPSGPESTHYFLAILNSKLINLFITSHSPVFSGSYYKFSGPYLKNVPIKKVNFAVSGKSLEKRVQQFINIYENRVLIGPENKNDIEKKGCNFYSKKLFDGQISQIIQESKVTHDILVYLAKQMSKRKRDQASVVSKFWDGLAGVSKSSSFENLRNKGKWEKSLAKDPACEPYVDAKSRSTKHIDDSLGWDEEAFKAFAGMLIGKSDVTPAMVEVYRNHAPKHKALSSCIEETDDLIDQIVYRLYGLTKEEVEIVESSFK